MIKAITNDEVRREEFHYLADTADYNTLIDELNGDFVKPDVIGKEGDLYSLYYLSKPPQFSNDYRMYAIKVDNTSGDYFLKGYEEGNTSGIVVDYPVIATGIFINGSNKYTLYRSDEDMTFEEALVNPNGEGITYQDGNINRETIYKIKEI